MFESYFYCYFHWLDYLHQLALTKPVTVSAKTNRKQTVLGHNVIVAQMELGSTGNHRTKPAVITSRALDCSVKKSLGPAESVHY